MNKLQLVRQLARNVGDYRSIDRIVPHGAVGAYSNWIDDAWRDLQSGGLWRWMRGTAIGFATPSRPRIKWSECYDESTGVPIEAFNQWRAGVGSGYEFPRYVQVRSEDLSEDGSVPAPPPPALLSRRYGTEQIAPFAEWDAFRAIYDIGDDPRGAPSFVSISPANEMAVGPRPGDETAYRIRMDYYRGPSELTSEDQEPDLPRQFHQLLVYDAMLHFGLDRARPEVVDSSRQFSSQMRSQLEAAQTESMAFGPALLD